MVWLHAFLVLRFIVTHTPDEIINRLLTAVYPELMMAVIPESQRLFPSSPLLSLMLIITSKAIKISSLQWTVLSEPWYEAVLFWRVRVERYENKQAGQDIWLSGG